MEDENIEFDDEMLDAVLKLSRQAHHRIWWPFTGISMLPNIKAGDRILIQHGIRSIRLGDVAVFGIAGQLVAHRVVLIKRRSGGNIYRMKGDNLRFFDAPVHESLVLGRVTKIQRDGKFTELETSHARFRNLFLAALSYARGYLYKIVDLKYLFR